MIRDPSAAPSSSALFGPEHLHYLYGVVPAGSAAHQLLKERRVVGLQAEEPLFPIEAEGLVAAVSRVPAATFDEEQLNTLVTDLNRLTPLAVRHEEAVRALLHSPLVPMTFGAVYRNPARVAEMLRERAPAFRALLGGLHGRQEWGLNVFSNTPRLLEAAVAGSDEIRRLDAEAAAAGPGRAYLIAKKRERLLASEAGRVAGQILTTIHERLASLSAAAVQDDPGPPQPGTEQLALKAAFLVEERAVDAFRTAAAELERSYAPRGLRLEVSGPWAPYSFVRQGSAAALEVGKNDG